MKTPIIALGSIAVLGLALAAPVNAQASEVRVSIQLGVPLIAYPHVVYRPVPVYEPPVLYRPAPWYRHTHYYRSAPRHEFDHYRNAAPVYHQDFVAPRKIEAITIDPRLQH